MKTAFYMENGKSQIVLTPEDDFEKEIIKKITTNQIKIAQYTGSFSECLGGYIRQYNNENSLMLLLKEDKEEQ